MTLTVVQDATLAGAEAEADRIRRAAREAAKQLLADARAEAAALVERRRSAAEGHAATAQSERLARARADARASVLEAQRAILDDASIAARAAVRSLVDDPRYERLIERVSADAREQLGSFGVVEVTAAPEGGIIARVGSRELDYSLDAQTDRCLQAIAGELEQLWR